MKQGIPRRSIHSPGRTGNEYKIEVVVCEVRQERGQALEAPALVKNKGTTSQRISDSRFLVLAH